jgi:uncharacterized membrane protein YcjF (UPF0283 family)
VIPLSDFYPLEEENGDYLLNETYRFTYNKKKSNGILKVIGNQDICEEMMESLVSLQQDEALRAKKNKQPTNKEAEQAASRILDDHNTDILKATNETLEEKLKEYQHELKEAKDTIQELQNKVKELQDKDTQRQSALDITNKDKLVSVAVSILALYGEEKDLDQVVTFNS